MRVTLAAGRFECKSSFVPRPMSAGASKELRPWSGDLFDASAQMGLEDRALCFIVVPKWRLVGAKERV